MKTEVFKERLKAYVELLIKEALIDNSTEIIKITLKTDYSSKTPYCKVPQSEIKKYNDVIEYTREHLYEVMPSLSGIKKIDCNIEFNEYVNHGRSQLIFSCNENENCKEISSITLTFDDKIPRKDKNDDDN